MLLDDILRADWIGPIIVPNQNFRYWKRQLGFYYMKQQSVSYFLKGRICEPGLQYDIVATSELVVNFGAPAILVGNLATTQQPLSIVKIKTLLNPPSRFSYSTTLVAPRHTRTALSQRAAKSN